MSARRAARLRAARAPRPPGRARVTGWLALSLLVALCAGCHRRAAGVPAWAMHVTAPRVQRGMASDALSSRLAAEWASPGYRPDYLAPEQIALQAVADLRAGRDWDAAVLLAGASYRYHEQAAYAYAYGKQRGYEVALRASRGRLEPKAYFEFLEAEVKAFSGADFDDVLSRVAAVVGAPLHADSVQADLSRVLFGNVQDRFGAQQAVRARLQKLREPEPEQLSRPALAAALLGRLRRDVQDPAHAAVADFYLCHCPLASFRRAALAMAPEYATGNGVRAGVWVYRDRPEQVLGGLRSARPQTRSQSAIVLGVVDGLQHLPQLEAALGVERDPRVQQSLRFALVQMGEYQHLPTLAADLRSGNADRRAHAAFLTQWLPVDLQVELDEGALVRIVAASGEAAAARMLAAASLGDIATRRTLSPAALSALMQATGQNADAPAVQGGLIDVVARIEQFDRHKVLSAVRRRQQPAVAWFGRWRLVAEAQDLALLADVFAQTPPDDLDARLALVRVVAAIPGEPAQALLESWFTREAQLRTPIAIQLVLRDDVDKVRLRRLAATASDASALVLSLPLDGRPKQGALERHLSSDDPDARVAASIALRLFGNRELTGPLWANVAYHDARFYPGDVRVRVLSIAALLDIELNSRDRFGRFDLAAR